MRGTVGACNHKMAAAVVKLRMHVEPPLRSYHPTVAAAMAGHSRSPTPAKRKKGKRGAGGSTQSKSCPSSPSDFHIFQNPSNGMFKYHNFYRARARMCVDPCFYQEK
jgi:hypothetical protein